MIIEEGKFYKTTDGRKARVVGMIDNCPTHWEVFVPGARTSNHTLGYNNLGDFLGDQSVHGLVNLIEEWKEETNMTQEFKVGDFVTRDIWSPNAYEVAAVSGDEIYLYDTSVPRQQHLYSLSSLTSPLILVSRVETTPSPIQQRTVKELVHGTYGKVHIGFNSTDKLAHIGVCVGSSWCDKLTVQELRDAAKTFLEVADYLEGEK